MSACASETGHVLLQEGDARVVLDPRHGGAVREFSWRGRDVLRLSAPGAAADPFELASFPMVPYVNRIAHGRFGSGTRQVQLSPNWSGDSHPLHGQGWRAPWRVAEAGATTAELEFQGGGDEWPWRYCARQQFRLGAGLSLRLSVRNLSSTPMPAALGVHPYFPDAARAHLRAALERVWRTDAEALPVEELPVPPAWSFASGRAVAEVPLDHCFCGWDGRARLSWPDHDVQLEATGCSFLHVYVPPGGAFCCVEPQTVATGTFNRDPAAVPQVAPGEELAMTVTFTPGVP